MAGKVYDALYLQVLWHLYEAQSCFCHCGDVGGEDWIRSIVEFLVEIARGKASALSSLGPALSVALVSCSVGCASSIVFILWSIFG